MQLHRQLLILLLRSIPDPVLPLLHPVPLLQAVYLPVHQTVEDDGDEEHEAEDNGDVEEELLVVPETPVIPAGGAWRGGMGAAAGGEAVGVCCAGGPEGESIHVYFIILVLHESGVLEISKVLR